MKKFFILLSLCGLFLLSGCADVSPMDKYLTELLKANVEKAEAEASVVDFQLENGDTSNDAPAIDIPSNGGDNKVTFVAHSNWTASVVAATKADDLSWVSLSQTSGGAGTVNLVISVQENETSFPRSAVVEIATGNKVYGIQISQEEKIDYFYFENAVEKSNSIISMVKRGNPEDVPVLQYSYNGRDWEEFIPGTTEVKLTPADPKAYFKAETRNAAFGSSKADAYYFTTVSDATLKVGGNILYLLDEDADVTELPQYAFPWLFNGSVISSAEDLILPDSVSDYCYFAMFQNSKKLVTAPRILPATTLAKDCYCQMFTYCTSLVDAPELSAITLADECCLFMFYGCSGLVDAPALPATTLAVNCYYQMFCDCSSLVNAPALPATTLADNCYYQMFCDCSSLVNAPALPATTLAGNCYYGMFNGCKNLVNAPALPATTLADNCYNGMFQNCVSLVKAPALPATTLAETCYYGMFQDCESLVNAPELPATALTYFCYGYMFYRCISLVDAPVLPALTLAECCYCSMFSNCVSLVNAPALPATALEKSCYSSMFGNCVSLVNAPELPATTLAKECYWAMFYRCLNLVNAPALPATTLAESCYKGMFSECESLVNAPELPATALSNFCYFNMFLGCSHLSAVTMLATDINDSSCLYGWLNDAGTAASEECILYVDPSMVDNTYINAEKGVFIIGSYPPSN